MPRFACTLAWVPGALTLALALPAAAHAGPTGTDSGGNGTSDTGATGTGDTDASTTDATSTDATGTDATSTGTTGSSGESSTGSGSSETGATTTGAETGSTTGESATTRTTAETGDCGICDEHEGAIAFTTPGDEDDVSSPIEVLVTVTPRCVCDGCTCAEVEPMYTQIFLDTASAGPPCFTLECAWSINASLGSHSLYVSTAFTDDDMLATSIDVRVTEVAPGTDTGIGSDEGGPPTSETTTTAPGSVGEDPPKGCGCAAPGARPHPGWHAGWLVLLAGALRRRRARR